MRNEQAAQFLCAFASLRNYLRVIAGHQLSYLLPTGSSRSLPELAQFFEVVQIAQRRHGGKEARGLRRRIAEGMRDPSGYHHEGARTGPHGLHPHHKIQHAVEDVKALFMRVMHMRKRGSAALSTPCTFNQT